MRIKLMLLSGSQKAARLSYYIQQILTDIAVTFGHSFVILEDKISKLSLDEYGNTIAENAIVASIDCDAVISIAEDDEGLAELIAGLGCILCSHMYALPECLSDFSLLKSNELPAGSISYPMTLEKPAFTMAAEYLYKRAKTENRSLTEIPYQGTYRAAWEEVTGAAANKYFVMSPSRINAGDFLAYFLKHPQNMGIVLANKTACETLNEGAKSICCLPSFVFDAYLDDKGTKLYAVKLVKAGSEEQLSPFGLLYAVVDMLKNSLKLEKEAECLRACINNVLEAGWRTADIALEGQLRVTAEAIFKLISEQIELVAELI